MLRFKKGLVIFLTILMVLSLVVGCAPKPVTEPIQDPAPQPEPPKFDKEAYLVEETAKYFAAIPDNNNMIPAKDMMELIEGNPGAVLAIDIRAAEDYAKGHVPGAINIPLMTIGENLERLPKNRQLFMICYSRQTSGQTVGALKFLGFNAISMASGMNNWPADLGDKLVTDEVALPSPVAPTLNEQEQAKWDAVKNYFAQMPTSWYMIPPADLHSTNESNPDAIFILDHRAPEYFDKDHIEGAVNIPWKQIGNNYDKLPKNRPVYVTCYSGQTAGQSIALLRIAGFNAISLRGGMNGGWTRAELPTVTK